MLESKWKIDWNRPWYVIVCEGFRLYNTSTQQKLWSNPPSGEADNRQGGGFFSKLFHAGAAGAELRSLSRVSNFKYEICSVAL